MSENFTNFYSSQIMAAVDGDDPFLVVLDAAGAPSAPQFRVVVQDGASDITNRELMIVTNVISGTTFQVTRAAEGTSGVSHVSGSFIAHVLTAGGFVQGATDISRTISVTTVRRTTGQLQSVSGDFEPISFGTEDEDTDGTWAIGTPTKIIIPSVLNGRRAVFWGVAGFDASTAGNYRGLAILKGGTSLSPLAQQLVADLATAIGVVLQVQSHVVTLATGDEYTLVQRIDNTTIGTTQAGFGFYTV